MTRKSKLKLDVRNKSYNLQDSPFYKLRSKKLLAKRLNTSLAQLTPLRLDEGNYSEFLDKERKIQKPNRELDIVHTRIASLLSRIQTPSYLHSGKKGHSNVSNAYAHVDATKLMATDIKSFFPSTNWKMIFSFFMGVMKCSPDVSEFLADLCTCHKCLPTGSRISMPLAYWANVRMFNELNSLSLKHGVKMTVYVDDLTFSGDAVNKLFKSIVSKVISKHDHIMHPTKTKLYSTNQSKLITGVIVKEGSLQVRNEQHLKLSEEFVLWHSIKDKRYALESSITSRLVGRLHSMGTIDSRYKEKARGIRQHTSS
ncbi:reverse transcriptase family protein [Vibrio kasasachensis]|uniref:reverse transcriptase family protein n=1 Tax=Vibrio kasasachensis TaxID=2910248 RepID=UPI003D14F0CD